VPNKPDEKQQRQLWPRIIQRKLVRSEAAAEGCAPRNTVVTSSTAMAKLDEVQLAFTELTCGRWIYAAMGGSGGSLSAAWDRGRRGGAPFVLVLPENSSRANCQSGRQFWITRLIVRSGGEGRRVSATSITLPWSGGCTVRGFGASIDKERCVRQS
jgi:hypothetical protein